VNFMQGDGSSPGKPTALLSGMIATTPQQGGATWAVLQYLLGLRRLGWNVFFVEALDLSRPGASDSVKYCTHVMDRFGLTGQWALIQPDSRLSVGMERLELDRVAAAADMLINVSGTLADHDILGSVGIRVFLDLDPAFVQLWHDVEGIDMGLDAHTHFVTLADNIGEPDCLIPSCGRAWIPTLPPVVLEEWPVATGMHHQAVTTIAHWRGYGSIEHKGIHFGQKAHSWRSLFELPQRTQEHFEPALEIHPGDDCDLRALTQSGWTILDPMSVAATPDGYRQFVQDSKAELCVAKSGYVVSESGWFSDRSACYLASGRPVIAQDTGFGRRLPTGEGLFEFRNIGDAVEIFDDLRRRYRHHQLAARNIAEQFLDSDRVLQRLIDRVLS
jgi:hypothetical protein